MRILHLGWGFSPWRAGGLITYVEDLKDAQAARGHEVSYFFSGRHYPFISGPRLKRWRRGGVAMLEVVNAPIIPALEHGTRNPERDLSEPRMEAAFRRVLGAIKPEVLHIQELLGLPSSFIEIARTAGVPMLMTLQDYGPLCATLRLFDADGAICTRRDIGADCVTRNGDAPADAGTLIERTLDFETARVRRVLRVGERVDFTFLGPLIGPLRGHAIREGEPPGREREAAPVALPDPDGRVARAFQRRRDVNVERLGRVNRLVAQSRRVIEIYRTLGVRGEEMTTLPFTLRHIEHLRPRAMTSPPASVTFATLNGCASPSKGSRAIMSALRALRGRGQDERFRLRVLGYVDPAIRDEMLTYEGVEVRGRYRREDLDDLLEDVDVGIMPSMWEEALGYVGLELIAKGIPLIANPLGGIVEYAREGQTAWLNPSCSGEGLAEIMSLLINDPALIVAMHERLLALRDDVVIPMHGHVDAIDEIYHQLIAAPRPPETPAPAGG